MLLLPALASAQSYNFNIGGLRFSSGASVPGSCSPDGQWFFKNVTTKSWYQCVGGTYSAVGGGGSGVTSVGLTANGGGTCGALAITGSPVTTTGTLAETFTGVNGDVWTFDSSGCPHDSGILASSLAAKTSVFNSGTTVGFSGFWAGLGTNFASAGSISGGGVDIPSNNIIHALQFDIRDTQVVGHLSWRITTGDNNTCVMDVGLYDETGATLLLNTGGVSCNSAANVSTAAAQGQVTITPQTVYLAWCGTATSAISSLAYAELGMSADGSGTTTSLKNINGKRYVTTSAACTAGVLPSTASGGLGTLTAVASYAGQDDPPATWMEP